MRIKIALAMLIVIVAIVVNALVTGSISTKALGILAAVGGLTMAAAAKTGGGATWTASADAIVAAVDRECAPSQVAVEAEVFAPIEDAFTREMAKVEADYDARMRLEEYLSVRAQMREAGQHGLDAAGRLIAKALEGSRYDQGGPS